MNLQAALGWGFIGALVAVAAVAAVQTARLENAKGDLAETRACLGAIADESARPSVSEACPKAVAEEARQARQMRLCRRGLAAGDVAVVERACPPEILALDRQVAADGQTIASLHAELSRAAQSETQAVLRAEARGRAQAERDARARLVRDAAPRDVDGLRVFGAGRLCERFETHPCA